MSPCAMLITFITPKVIARPSAVRIKMELRLRLLERAELRSVAFIPCSVGGKSKGLPRRRLGERAAGGQGRGLTLLRRHLHVRTLGRRALQPVAVPTGEGDLRVRLRIDRVGRVDDVELLV